MNGEPSGGRELLVLRHAKSAWDTMAATDFDRPLAKRGKRDAPRMGSWLAAEGLAPDVVVASPAKRAEQTVQRVLEAAGCDPEDVNWEPRVYDASVSTLLMVLADCPVAPRVMIVGHNPGFEMLVDYLSGGAAEMPARGKFFPPVALTHFVMPDDWTALGRGCADLVQIVRPKEL